MPPSLGLVLALRVHWGHGRTGAAGEDASERRPGSQVETAEVSFLKVFVAAQAVLLAVLVCNRYRGVPAVFLILCAVAGAVHVVTRHTPFGRALLAIGGNEEAARMSGIPVESTITAAYALLGLLVALTGFLQTSYAGAATVSVGELMELDAIAACVIGGASLKGGRGSVQGALFGAAVMATLLNGMTLLAITPEWKLIARGTALVAAVLFEVRSTRRTLNRRRGSSDGKSGDGPHGRTVESAERQRQDDQLEEIAVDRFEGSEVLDDHGMGPENRIVGKDSVRDRRRECPPRSGERPDQRARWQPARQAPDNRRSSPRAPSGCDHPVLRTILRVARIIASWARRSAWVISPRGPT